MSGVVIIITVFLPLLSLEGLEGRLFAPVALTIAFAMASALLLSLTVVPALSATILRPGGRDEPWLVRKIAAIYEPLLRHALDRRFMVAAIAVFGLVARRRRRHANRPDLHAGDERGHARHHHPQASDDQRRRGGGDRHAIQREIMSRVPEVKGMMARAGADELGIDPVGLNETDKFLTLAPTKRMARSRAWTG